uniref:Protein krueppel n=1 Tax=Anopheles dirus TaxID=7168 RepID=A0A1Y9H2T4_9DIPT
MANAAQKMIVICRLCLSQDESQLRPVTETIDVSLTILEIKRFSGIPINTDDDTAYAMCFECADRLKTSIAFRNTCLNNDGLFQELRAALMTREGCAPEDAVVIVKEGEPNPLGLQYFQTGEDSMEMENITMDPDNEYIANEQADSYMELDRVVPEPVSGESEDAGAASVPGQTIASDHPCDTPDGYPTDSIKPSLPIREIKPMRAERSRSKKLCTICGKMVTSMRSHIVQHIDHTKHACPYCPVEMTVKGNMTKHINSVHLKTINKTCKLCGKGFTQNKSYGSHMITVHGIGEKHPCTLCSKVFNFQYSLKDHMTRVHSEVRRLGCPICGKLFKVKQALAMHLRSHSAEQPYACSQCPKRFKSRFAKKTHELTHSGVVFECGFCCKTYRYKALLSMHLRKMHPTDLSTQDGGVYEEVKEEETDKDEA